MKRHNTLIFSLLLMFSSCMENEMYDKINPEIFPKNAEDALTLVNAAYDPFGPQGKTMFHVAGGYVAESEMVSDYADISWGWDIRYNSYEANSWCMDYVWRRIYDRFRDLSSMTLNIDRISSVEMDEKLRSRYIGEIKCARGFLAFLLYDMYGPVVIADLETLKNPFESQTLPRATEEEMQNYIETSLKEAAEVLPYKYPSSQYGRFTKGLANTVLLKLYMMTGRWEDAEKMGRELMDSQYGYKLEPDYNLLFSLAGERNAEIIYAVPCVEGVAENEWFAHVLTPDFPTPEGMNITKWNGFKMTWPAYESFDPKDIRRQRIIGEYTGTDGTVHNRKNDRDSGQQGLLYWGAIPLKYKIEGVKGQFSEVDLVIYRYADVLTLLSEAIVRKGNAVTQEAVDLMNQVRVTHGGLEPYQMSDFSSVADFLDKMLEERGHEFWWEGVRRQDLLRHGKFIEYAVKKAEFAGQPTGKITTQVDGKYKYERFPIPPMYITEGQGVIKQNPGF